MEHEPQGLTTAKNLSEKKIKNNPQTQLYLKPAEGSVETLGSFTVLCFWNALCRSCPGGIVFQLCNVYSRHKTTFFFFFFFREGLDHPTSCPCRSTQISCRCLTYSVKAACIDKLGQETGLMGCVICSFLMLVYPICNVLPGFDFLCVGILACRALALCYLHEGRAG